jgi:hypothetical protein
MAARIKSTVISELAATDKPFTSTPQDTDGDYNLFFSVNYHVDPPLLSIA